jgi:hypothetical protein
MAIPANIEFLFHDLGRLQINRNTRPAVFDAADTALADNRLLSSSGTAEIYYDATSGAVNVQLPNPTECAGQTRVIGNYTASANSITVKQWNATDFAGATVGVVFPAAANPAGLASATPALRSFYCDGTTWINVGASDISVT